MVSAEHDVKVRSAAESVFRMLADIDNWPRIFRPFVHLAELGPERIGMWTSSGKTVEHWAVRRSVDEKALRIDFRPEQPHPPLTSLHRAFVVEPLSSNECLVRLVHDFTVAEPEAADAVTRMIDEVAESELASVKAAAELRDDLLLVLHDEVRVAGTAREVYEFLWDAAKWPDLLPHVANIEVVHEADGVQLLDVDTHETDGSMLHMRTARVGRAPHEIHYKQLLLPPIGSSHHVRWQIRETASGVSVESQQTVVIDEEGIRAMLGADADLTAARGFISRELNTKVRLVLDNLTTFFAH